ncbi:MAG: hypothetical protein HZC14_01030 [Candidatus Niyogibacteria bacterium]|nr:hypothetical protein [Candidatus Niyogibacteria bacterium]
MEEKEQNPVKSDEIGVPQKVGQFNRANQEKMATEPNNKPENIPAIRTYSGDVQEYIQKKGTSYINAMAQAARRKQSSNSISEDLAPKPYLKIILGGGAAILLTTIIAVGTYFWFFAKKPTESAQTPRPPQALIRADHENIIFWEAGNAQNILTALQNALAKPQISGEFTYLPAKKTENKQEKFLSSAELLKNAGIKTPQDLIDNLAGFPTFGAIDALGRNETVFLSPISDYERAFAAMLRWEPAILADYQSLLPQDKDLNTGKITFEDVVIKNNDARALKNIENEIVLAYTIFNRKILIIASSKTALEQVLERLISSPPTL